MKIKRKVTNEAIYYTCRNWEKTIWVDGIFTCTKGTNGDLHRLDGPAVIGWDGTQEWYSNGVISREDGPAVIYSDGSTDWAWNGHYGRKNDGPTSTNRPYKDLRGNTVIDFRYFHSDTRETSFMKKTIFQDRIEYRNSNGKLHREDGPALIYLDGIRQEFYKNGKQHRENGPAILYFAEGIRFYRIIYYKHGKIHRLNGLADIELPIFTDDITNSLYPFCYAVINGRRAPSIKRP